MNKYLEKQIEEAAILQLEESFNISLPGEFDAITIKLDSVKREMIDFAKSSEIKEYWQQGMYTEEEVKKAYIQGVRDYCRSSKGLDSFLKTEVNIWFEQNKKK